MIAVLMIALIINLFSVITAKQKLDLCADQLTRQIQLAGEVNGNTQDLFEHITAEINGLTIPRYTVDTDYYIGRKIQLGTPFYVEMSARVTLGGFGELISIPITLVSRTAGVSEYYWK